MENQTQFEVKPPSGTSPRPEDTPRTRNLKELRKKRLQYFSATNANSSSTTDSGSADINLNNIQTRHNDQIQEDVRVSMVADTRVMSMDAHRASSHPVSAISRDSGSRESLQQSSSFYRNPLNMDSVEGNNNGNYRGESNIVGSSNVGGILGSNNVGSILGSNNAGSIIGANNLGTRASMSNLGGTARREMLLNSFDNQRPVSSSTLGFSLPTLPPESNIVSQRESTFGSRTPQMSKANRTKVGGPKGKAIPGKPPKKRSPASSRDLYNNNQMLISGHGVTNSERDQNRQIQSSMIEADFEDDYSELGLSVDQQRFEGLRVDYHIPAFSSSHKPKHIRPGSASGLRASQSMEHFGGLSVSAAAEDLHQRPEVPDRYEFSMRKSATHEGLVNHAEESSARQSTDNIDDIRMEDRTVHDLTAESIASSVDNDSKQINYTPPNYDSNVDDKPPITRTSNNAPAVPRILFPEKPIHMESTDFEKTRTQSTSDSEMTAKSVIEQEFSSNMLQSVLGKDRMARLLKNLEESAWIADDSTVAGSRVHDVTLESFRSETEVGKSNNQLPLSHSTDIDDLGLTTHRPEDEHLQLRNQDGRQEGRRSRTTSDSKSDHRSNAASDSVSSSMRKSTKYSYCTDEIYARARNLSHTSAEEDGARSAASSVEHFSAKLNQQVSASKSSTFSDFVNRKHDQAELDEPDSGAKFDYVRGIHSVKKEFYKTVAITDSTAVSDNSLSTTKLSPRGQNTAKLSPRGQIPNRKPQEQSLSQGHRRSGSNSGQLGQSSQEEHIEGIRQHVADIRMQQFEDKIKAGMPYTTASIERYFASMEKLNLETVQGFEPVPEPDILETPRGDEIDNSLDVKGTQIGPEHGPHVRNSLKGITSYEKDIHSKPGIKSDSSFKTNFESRPNRVELEEKKSNIDKALTDNVATSKEAASLTQREKWEQFKIDNDKKKLSNDLRNEGSDDDDLFTKVTSVVEDEKMTERFREVGINFDFLKQKPKSRSKRSSCSSEMDVVSSHSSEESIKFPTPQNSDNIVEESLKKATIPKKNNNIRESVKPVTPRKNNNVGAKSSKKAEMNGTKSSPKMTGVGTTRNEELNKKAEIVTKKSELEIKNDVDDEVEILFRMSPRDKYKSVSLSEKQPPGPTLSGEPTASKSGLLLQQGDSFDSSVNLNSSTSSMSQVKVCPECAEVNKIYVTWCVECGAVLSGVDPVPCKGKRDVSRQLGVSTSTSLSQSATNFKNRLEESMYNPPGASSLSAAWMQQSQGKLSLDKSQVTPEKHQEAGTTNRDVLSLKLEGGVRDSDDFEYEIQQSPVRNLPKSLQSELSLDLSAKLETSNKTAKPERNSASDQLAELSEAILFEYSEVVSPKKFLPPALQEELNLNLSLDGSQTTASLRGISMAGPSWMNKSGGNTNNNHLSQSLEEQVEEEELTPKAEDPGRVGMAVQASNSHQVAAWAVQAAPVAAQANDGQADDDVPDDPDEDEDNLIDMIGQDVEQEDEERIIYEKFVQRLRTDYRFKQTRPQSALQPTVSSGRPKTAAAEGRKRPQSAHTASSKVRSSIESPGYQRKWGHSSTLAWNSKSHGEVQPRSSLKASIAEDIRLSSSLLRNRPGSAVGKSSSKKPGPGGDSSPKKSSSVPRVSKQGTRQRGKVSEPAKNGSASSSQSPKESMGMTQSALYSSVSGSTSRPLKSNLMNTYAKYFEMSPRIAAGEFSQWLCLPDEIWLHVCSYLRHKDLSRVAQTCMQLHRVALDESLWKTIVVKKNHNMIDEWLSEIGRRKPASLSLVQCHGEKVSAHGLRELFRQCSDSLKELNFTGCSRGEMKGDNILLHAASRCRNITHFDASWSNVNDHGVIALIEASHRLESVCLNGCQVVTDEAIHALVTKHGKHLKTLELFGCFNMTPRSAASIASSCKALTILNLGQCWKLTDASIARLAPSLTEVINLDLRGCKQMKDTTLHHLMNYCKKLQSLSIANCPNLTDVSLTEIATYCSAIQSLDLCGCKGITDMGVRALAMACQSLEYLDVSSSAVTHKSVSTLASYCHARLEVLKLNFCKHINVPSLVRLAKNCKKLAQLYLYGVDGLRHIDQVRVARPGLWIQI